MTHPRRFLVLGSLLATIAAVPVRASAATSASIPATASLTAGALSLTPPSAITFSGALDGQNLALVDGRAADEQMNVIDATGSGNGWNVSAWSSSAFSDGSSTLPASSLTLDGSTASSSATTSPGVACASGSTCTPASDASVSYPVDVPDSGTPGSIIYAAGMGTGMGSENVSGLDWWLSVPANTQAGTYTTTVTLSLSSGPTPRAAPEDSSSPSISGTSQQGDVLTVSDGTWTSSPSYSYQWYDCNNPGSGCTAIPGATSSSYTLQGSDVQYYMKAVVTATNSGGSSSAGAVDSTAVAPGSPSDPIIY